MNAKLIKLCAQALHDVPHENGCNVRLLGDGFPCTCKLRFERLTQGFTAVVLWVERNRESLRHKHRDEIHATAIKKFRAAAAADVTIRLRAVRGASRTEGATE